jgi:hypothetical protein
VALGYRRRPFEVLMLEVDPAAPALSLRAVTDRRAGALGVALPLTPAPPERSLAVRFSDASQLEARKMPVQAKHFRTRLPPLTDQPPMLAIALRLRQGADP